MDRLFGSEHEADASRRKRFRHGIQYTIPLDRIFEVLVPEAVAGELARRVMDVERWLTIIGRVSDGVRSDFGVRIDRPILSYYVVIVPVGD